MNRLFALAAISAGILWITLTLALVGAWERGDTFPTYEFLNGLRPLPLTLMAVALYGIYQTAAPSVGRTGRGAFIVSLVGLALLAAGAALEFWIGGGVRDGDADLLSNLGWFAYLFGYLVLSIGLIAFGIAVRRAQVWGKWSWLPLATGIVWASFLFCVILQNAFDFPFTEVSQVLFGALWMGMGVVLWSTATMDVEMVRQ
jgi:hypothetical protein